MKLLIAPEEKKKGVAIFVIPPQTPSNQGSFYNGFGSHGANKNNSMTPVQNFNPQGIPGTPIEPIQSESISQES